MSSFGEGTTIVDGTTSVPPPSHYHQTNGKARFAEGPEKPQGSSSANFAAAVDYMEEERLFFVKIGKDGLIAALQKLDRQLRAVRMRIPLLRDVGTCSLMIVSSRLDACTFSPGRWA